MPQLSRLSRSATLFPSLSALWASSMGSGALRLGRVSVWDPRLLIAQMICLQAWFYLIYGLLLAVFVVSSSVPLMSWLFDSQYLQGLDNAGTWSLILVELVSSVAAAYMIFTLVARAKLCLDFSATIFFFHLLLCSNYHQFPRELLWWFVNICCLILTAVLAEYWCLKAEMSPISFGSTSASNGEDAHQSHRGFVVRQQQTQPLFDNQEDSLITMQTFKSKKKSDIDDDLEQQQFIL